MFSIKVTEINEGIFMLFSFFLVCFDSFFLTEVQLKGHSDVLGVC